MEQYATLPVLDASPFEDCEDYEPFEEYKHRKWWARLQVPWTIWRYIALEVVRIMILSILAISLLYSAIAAYQTVRSGIQFTFIWPFLIKTIAYPLYFSIPLSLIFGVTLGLGKMVADLETSAMRCHSVSHVQLYAPVAMLGLLAAVASFFVNGWVVPELHYEKRNLQKYVVKQLENLGSGRNRTILLPGGGGSLLVGAYQGHRLRRVEIDLNRELQSKFVPDFEDKLPSKLPERVTVMAKTGSLEFPENHPGVLIRLRGVEVLVPERFVSNRTGDGRHIHKFSITETFSIPLLFEKKKPGVKDLKTPDLSDHIRKLEEKLDQNPDDAHTRTSLAWAVSEWHRRLAFSLSSLLFPLIGASLCFLLNRRGRLVPFFTGNLLVISLFFPLLMVGLSIGERGYVPSVALALPNLALLGVGIYLTRKVLRQ